MNEPTPETVTYDRLLGFLGLCRRAGRVVCGTPQVCEALRGKEKPALVLYAADVSASTGKRIRSKSDFYGVAVRALPVGGAELAHALGKSGNLAACAVLDASMAHALQEKLSAAGL